jgi:hypothetical protein
LLKSSNTNSKHKHQQQTAAPEEENPRFGVLPYEYENTTTTTRKHSKFDVREDLIVVPVEIEIDSMLYNLIKVSLVTVLISSGDTYTRKIIQSTL